MPRQESCTYFFLLEAKDKALSHYASPQKLIFEKKWTLNLRPTVLVVIVRGIYCIV